MSKNQLLTTGERNKILNTLDRLWERVDEETNEDLKGMLYSQIRYLTEALENDDEFRAKSQEK